MFIKKYLTSIVLLTALNSNAQQADSSIAKKDSTGQQVLTFVEQMPKPAFDFNKYLDYNLRYPDQARVARIEGRVVTQFVVGEDGKISGVHVIHGLGSGCDEEAIRVIKKMDRWLPGKQGGVPVKVLSTVPITFKLTDEELKLPAKVYTYVDQMPKSAYDIGEYLGNNMQYPEAAREANIEGRVVVKFVVADDGSIVNARVVQGIGSECDEEALRVVKDMPKWLPGKQDGIPVAVYFSLPIIFKLTDDGKQPATAQSNDQRPMPPQGMHDYFKNNLRYPDSARAAHLEGKVNVKFAVNIDGSISDATIVKGIGSGCDDEALRLVNNMPRWKPGTRNGKPAKIYSIVQVVFKL